MNYDYRTILGALLIGVAIVMIIYAFVNMVLLSIAKNNKNGIDNKPSVLKMTNPLPPPKMRVIKEGGVINKSARLANNLNTNNMSESKKESALEIAHGLVHDISFNVREGNIDEAQKLLKELDMLLHDEIHLQGTV